MMPKMIDKHTWVYVVVQNPGREETIIGQRDPDHDITFIPLFRDKDAAMQCLGRLAREPGQTLEVQAIIYEDLVQYAAEGGFLLFVLDSRGQITSKMTPDGRLL